MNITRIVNTAGFSFAACVGFALAYAAQSLPQMGLACAGIALSFVGMWLSTKL